MDFENDIHWKAPPRRVGCGHYGRRKPHPRREVALVAQEHHGRALGGSDGEFEIIAARLVAQRIGTQHLFIIPHSSYLGKMYLLKLVKSFNWLQLQTR
jgi:hypothetical protein